MLSEAHIHFSDNSSAIVPVYPPEEVDFRELSYQIHRRDLFINPIEPPAVPAGGERFRVSLMATHTEADVREAVSILKGAFARFSQ